MWSSIEKLEIENELDRYLYEEIDDFDFDEWEEEDERF